MKLVILIVANTEARAQPDKIAKKYNAPPLVIERKYCSDCGEIISTKAKFCDKCRAPQKG